MKGNMIHDDQAVLLHVLLILVSDDDIMRATGMKACLKLVIQSKLQRDGFIAVPSDVRDDVEYVSSETQVLQIIERFIENRKSLRRYNVSLHDNEATEA